MVTLTFDPTSAEEVQTVQRLLPLFGQGVKVQGVDEERFWTDLRPRLGSGSLLPLCVEAARLGTFPNIAALAIHMGVAEKTVQSWRRNLGRSERKANEACATSLTVFAWDAFNQRYQVPARLAAAILSTRKA